MPEGRAPRSTDITPLPHYWPCPTAANTRRGPRFPSFPHRPSVCGPSPLQRRVGVRDFTFEYCALRPNGLLARPSRTLTIGSTAALPQRCRPTSHRRGLSPHRVFAPVRRLKPWARLWFRNPMFDRKNKVSGGHRTRVDFHATDQSPARRFRSGRLDSARARRD